MNKITGYRPSTLYTIFQYMGFTPEQCQAMLHGELDYTTFQCILDNLLNHTMHIEESSWCGLYAKTLGPKEITTLVYCFFEQKYPAYHDTLSFNRIHYDGLFETSPRPYRFDYLIQFFHGDPQKVVNVWQQRLQQGIPTRMTYIPQDRLPIIAHMFWNVLYHTARNTHKNCIDSIYQHIDRNIFLQEWPQVQQALTTPLPDETIRMLLPPYVIDQSHALWPCVPHDRFIDIRIILSSITPTMTADILAGMNEALHNGDAEQYLDAFIIYVTWLTVHADSLQPEVTQLLNDINLHCFEGCDPMDLQRISDLKDYYVL